MKKILFITLLCSLLSLTIGYPLLFLTDEWITSDQLNHLVTGDDLLFGYDPYGASDYAASHHDTLCYTLALPVASLPAYYLFSLFGDDFRLAVVMLWSALLLALLLMIEFWYPEYARWRGIPWTWAGIVSWGVLFVLNAALYRQFWFVRGVHPYDVSVYPEVAAIVFTNSVAFALLAVVAFLIFREVLGSDRWGLFGLAATVCCSSYLFWSGNAKDHALVALLFAVALYCFTLYLSRENILYLVMSFIAVGWTAFARPELGPALAIGFFLFALAAAVGKGRREAGKVVLAAVGVPLGALPLLVNNWGLSGNPLVLPWTAGYAAASGKAPQGLWNTLLGHYTLRPDSLLTGLYGAFFEPARAGAAAFFQVSPLSFFALLLAAAAGYALIRKRPAGISHRDTRLLAFFALAAVLVVLTYARSIPGMPASPGIVPDMRYLSPAYLPMLVIGVYAFKHAGMDADGVRESLKTLFWLAVIDLPLIFVVLQVIAGQSRGGQVTFITTLTYLLLTGAAVLYAAVLAKRASPRLLAYAVPVLMFFPLAWELVVDFRFATGCWEGYHFWIPVVQYIWYVQYAIFPL
ncbi:hypothetical protein HL657_11890 [Methanoculleus sp. YWC-01]|uniref:Glycosyltransferase RgtA/B/C/D-like domain-containing protein n=1 Tax=Methanoculleus nereidis TaxID=2735141 RepID=A0ABU3Z5M4_9EURY|nr:hypothetical protein [Methanoculleus sp. YWC-01]MDV4343855.1 hypothetical protein [Methanoculleus sp. YWC-01]